MNPIFSLLALTSLLLSCSQASESEFKAERESQGTAHSLEMNDISILIPYNEQPLLANVMPRLSENPDPETFAPGLSAARLDSKGFVFPWTKLERDTQLSTISDSIPAINDDMKDFILTSIRIDPCSNELQIQNDIKSCTPELRIVWQKVSTAGSLEFLDSHVHTIYRLEANELNDILATLRKLREEASVDTSGMPLLPHPVIAKEGTASPYLRGVIGLVHRFARASKLTEVANMAANTAVNWTLGHFAIHGEEPAHFPIPTLGDGDPIDAVNLGLVMSSEEGSLFAPHSISKIGTLVSSGLLPKREPSADLKRELEYFPILNRTVEAFAVENPKLFNSKSINCATCHVTEKQKAGHDFVHAQVGNKIWQSRFARPSFSYPSSPRGARERLPEEGRFLSLEEYGLYQYSSTTWNLETPFQSKTATRLLMFSFVSSKQPAISARVVNDTAESLDFIEKQKL